MNVQIAMIVSSSDHLEIKKQIWFTILRFTGVIWCVLYGRFGLVGMWGKLRRGVLQRRLGGNLIILDVSKIMFLVFVVLHV